MTGAARPVVLRAWDRLSIRRRLILSGVAIVSLAVAVLMLITTLHIRTTLMERNDDDLAATTTGLSTFAQSQLARIERGERPATYRPMERFHVADAVTAYGELIGPDGERVPLPRLSSESAPQLDPQAPPDIWTHADNEPFTIDSAAGPHRALIRRIPDSPYAMFVALPLQPTLDAVADLVRMELLAGGAVLAGFALLVVSAVRVSLRPLDDLSAVAGRITEGELSVRPVAAPPGTEIGQLTHALNEMLDAIERTVAERDLAQLRTQQFAADAAHELRTPVTAVLGYAQLYRSGGVPPQQLDRVFGRIEHEAKRLRDLVEGLLVLNRLDQPVAGADTGVEDLDLAGMTDLCAAAAADSMTIDRTHEIRVSASADLHVRVRACRDEVFQILANLLANVRAHTPPGTQTVVTVSTVSTPVAVGDVPASEVRITVTDDGPGIAPTDEDHVFDRFYRADASRSRSGIGPERDAAAGSGLGLSIVRALAAKNRGGVHLDRSAGVGTSIVVHLPSTP